MRNPAIGPVPEHVHYLVIALGGFNVLSMFGLSLDVVAAAIRNGAPQSLPLPGKGKSEHVHKRRPLSLHAPPVEQPGGVLLARCPLHELERGHVHVSGDTPAPLWPHLYPGSIDDVRARRRSRA